MNTSDIGHTSLILLAFYYTETAWVNFSSFSNIAIFVLMFKRILRQVADYSFDLVNLADNNTN